MFGTVALCTQELEFCVFTSVVTVDALMNLCVDCDFVFFRRRIRVRNVTFSLTSDGIFLVSSSNICLKLQNVFASYNIGCCSCACSTVTLIPLLCSFARPLLPPLLPRSLIDGTESLILRQLMRN
jgi:hypothetical protein